MHLPCTQLLLLLLLQAAAAVLLSGSVCLWYQCPATTLAASHTIQLTYRGLPLGDSAPCIPAAAAGSLQQHAIRGCSTHTNKTKYIEYYKTELQETVAFASSASSSSPREDCGAAELDDSKSAIGKGLSQNMLRINMMSAK
jgi:hypothetical protein